jgi:phosphate acetyltransferase
VSFVDSLRERAARIGGRIGFPEAGEPRTAEAILRLAREGAVRPVVVGDAVGDPGPEVEIVDSAAPEFRDLVADLLTEASTPGPVDALRFAVALLRDEHLDGVVAGARSSTAEVLRTGLNLLGAAPGTDTVSSSFYMVVRREPDETESVLTFTDAAVVLRPGPEQLAAIAQEACQARRLIVGDEPRVAFLSYSTHGSADGESVRRAREALRLFRERQPDILSDGELQVDAALVSEVAARKAPGSPLAGRANVLVFPDLDAGNIGYKLVHRLAGARALGPILQGLDRPLNDLSRGASVDDIVHVAYITALLAGRSRTQGSAFI